MAAFFDDGSDPCRAEIVAVIEGDLPSRENAYDRVRELQTRIEGVIKDEFGEFSVVAVQASVGNREELERADDA